MTLYEITENITEEPEEAVTIKEASKRLNRTVGSLYGAAAEGRLINGRYYLRAADRTLSRNKDRNLLLEYDLVRQKLGPGKILGVSAHSPEEALRAITLGGARLAGVAHRVGSLTPGKDADVVVTSGHPFDWNGSIRAVFLNGRRVK